MGGKTTKNYITNEYITKTGLGDSQYSGIMGGQGAITGNQAAITSDISALQTGQDTGFGNVQTGFDNLNTSLSAQFNTADQQRNDYAKANAYAQQYLNDQAIAREGLATDARTQIGSNITTGFEDMGGRFDTVDTNVGNVQSAVNQGFVDQAAGFADAQTNRDAQALAAQTDRDTQFAATGAALDQGFADTATGQSNILGGQTDLGKTLGEISTAQDTYAGQSLENQAAMQSGIDTAASTFDTYVDRYGEDQRLAQDSRNDLATAQANSAREIQKNMATYNDATGRDLYNLSGQLTSVQDQQTSAAAKMAANASQMANIDDNTRANFAMLGSSFNDDGALISSSVDQNGNTTQRDYDQRGNIVFTTFDRSGKQTGQNAIAIGPALRNLQTLQQGGTAASSGLASPFAQTS